MAYGVTTLLIFVEVNTSYITTMYVVMQTFRTCNQRYFGEIFSGRNSPQRIKYAWNTRIIIGIPLDRLQR